MTPILQEPQEHTPLNKYTVTTDTGEKYIVEYSTILNVRIILHNGDNSYQIGKFIDRN